MSEANSVTYGAIRHVFEPAPTVNEFEEWMATKPDFEDDWKSAEMEEVMNDKERSLYHKYNVTKVDTGEVVQNCIVLRPDRDRAAWDALWDYASYIAPDYPQFAHELGLWLNAIDGRQKADAQS